MFFSTRSCQKAGDLKKETFLIYIVQFETNTQNPIKGELGLWFLFLGLRKSVTHLSQATVEIIDDADYVEGTQYVSHFSFPLDFQFMAQHDKMAERPYLMLQVNSVDSWGRHRIEGYGFCRMPLNPGYH